MQKLKESLPLTKLSSRIFNIKDMEFGQYLFQLRSSKGFSQRHVADKLGIDISLLSKIEHGERQIQGHMIDALAEIFDLNLKQLHKQFLKNKIMKEYSNNPYFKEVVKDLVNEKTQ